MKWISDLFGRKKEGPLSRASLADAEKAIGEKARPEEEALSSKLSGLYASILERKQALAEAGERLEKAQPKEEIHERLLRAALTNKANIAKQISAITGSIRMPDSKDYGTALEFYESSSRIIREGTQRSMISYEYVKLAFEGEIREFREKAGQLEEAFIALKEELDLRKVTVGRAKELHREIGRMLEKQQKKKEQEDKAKELLGMAEGMKRELDAAKGRLEQLASGGRSRELEGLKKELDSAEAGLKKNREEAASIISPAERAIRKFRKAAEEGRTKYADLRQIDAYLASPAEALLSDKRFGICEMAAEMRTFIGTGDAEKDPKKAEKLLHGLGELTPERIRPIQLRNESLSLKKAALEKEISGSTVEAEKKELERAILGISGRTSELEAESARAKKQAIQLGEEIAKSAGELAKSISEFTGAEIKLDVG